MAKPRNVRIVVDPTKVGAHPVIFTLKTGGRRVFVSANLDKDNGIVYVDSPVTAELKKKIIDITLGA